MRFPRGDKGYLPDVEHRRVSRRVFPKVLSIFVVAKIMKSKYRNARGAK